MPNYNASIKNEFAYLREISILDVRDAFSLSIKDTLQLEASRIYILSGHLYIASKHSAYKLSRLTQDYLYLRSKIAIDSRFLFPTFSGKQLRYSKFIEHINRLTNQVELTTSWLSREQTQLLVNLRFNHQRQRYQQILACALMGTLATRPGEIAQLEKRDIDFGAKIIWLRSTKGQEIQTLPIYPVLLPILRKYLSHLDGPTAPLFQRQSGKKWTRKDVWKTMQEYGKQYGIENMTAQKMRPTVVMHLHENGASLAEIQSLTRHKQLGTLLDHYITPRRNDARKALTHLHPFPNHQSLKTEE
jgi:integrase